ncbi:hypothetical protein RHOW815_000569 [Candidatus Rhabdochlamydia sp. W815]|nr:hypothetical protein RHOW815_000569 [Candidatus Rhabdochlamydia sp. W815]
MGFERGLLLKITIEILSSPAYSFFNSSVHFKLEKTSNYQRISCPQFFPRTMNNLKF